MAYDLEEQEQIAALKSWWNTYGNYVVIAVASAAILFSGYYGWRYYRHSQAAGAVTLYAQLDEAERAGDPKRVRDIASQITARFESTSYASFAALSAARASFESGDAQGAKAQLQWAIDHAKEAEVRDVARLRLAGVLLDQKDAAGALKLVEAKPVESLAGLYADLRGDILVALGRPEEARGAYQFALDRGEAGSPYRAMVQLKLDALGGTKR